MSTLTYNDLLTIILVIKDRPSYTKRWLNYANINQLPFKILIADGGKDKAIEQHLSIPGNYPNIDFKYLRYPYDATTKDYLNKISDALGKVSTPYVVLADDDDFFITDTLKKSIQFLEDHQDYSTCRGQNCIFIQKTKDKKVIFGPNMTKSNTSESALNRLNFLEKQFNGTFYDVHRTPNYQYIFKHIANIGFYYLPMVEHMIAYMDAIQGKIERLDDWYLLREEEHGQSTSRSLDSLKRILNGPTTHELNQMCKIIADELSKYTDDNTATDKHFIAIKTKFIDNLAYLLSNEIYAHYNIPLKRVVSNLKTWLVNSIERKKLAIAKFSRYTSQSLHYKKMKKSFDKHQKHHNISKKQIEEVESFLLGHTPNAVIQPDIQSN